MPVKTPGKVLAAGTIRERSGVCALAYSTPAVSSR